MNALVVVGAVSLGICGVAARAWAASVLWGWFIATPFGLPQITAAQALGLSLVFVVMLHPNASEDKRPIEVRIASFLIEPALILALGWIIRGVM